MHTYGNRRRQVWTGLERACSALARARLLNTRARSVSMLQSDETGVAAALRGQPASRLQLQASVPLP